MGKLFGRKKRYADDAYEEEEFDDDEIDDEEDDEELEEDSYDDEEDDLEEDDPDLYEDEDDELSDEDEADPDDEEDDMDGEDDDPDGEDDDSEDDDLDDDEDDDPDDEDDDRDDEEDDDPDDGDEEDDDPDDEEEWDEDDRRAFRRRRRVRNQIIAYSVVFVFLVLVLVGCISVGRSIAGVIREKKQAEEQAKLQAELEAQEAQNVVIDAPETIEEQTEEESEEEYLREIMDACLADMPLEDKVAGLFIVRPEAITGVSTVTQAGDGTREALNTYAVGGLVYFEKNILNKEQFTEMLSNTVSMSRYPIFLAVDEEGGSVSRVAGSSIGVTEVGDMAQIGATGDTNQAYEAGATIGGYLKELGFNLDLAPVADAADPGSSGLGDRVFGADAQAVGSMVASMVEGIEGTGVSACLKHFPGIGEVEEDTHDGRAETAKTLDEMRNYEFLPFKAGIDAGADFVMVSHVTAAAVDDGTLPSSLSKAMMSDTLRGELGFQGVIITDALDMSAITQYYTSEEAAVMAIDAGADMLLMPEDFEAAYNAVLTAVKDGTIPETRIDESLERIYRVKAAEKLRQMQGED